MTLEGNHFRCDGPGCSTEIRMRTDPPLSEQQKVGLAGFAEGRGWLVVGERQYCPRRRGEAARPKLSF
jgi:hypothetical protein